MKKKKTRNGSAARELECATGTDEKTRDGHRWENNEKEKKTRNGSAARELECATGTDGKTMKKKKKRGMEVPREN